MIPPASQPARQSTHTPHAPRPIFYGQSAKREQLLLLLSGTLLPRECLDASAAAVCPGRLLPGPHHSQGMMPCASDSASEQQQNRQCMLQQPLQPVVQRWPVARLPACYHTASVTPSAPPLPQYPAPPALCFNTRHTQSQHHPSPSIHPQSRQEQLPCWQKRPRTSSQLSTTPPPEPRPSLHASVQGQSLPATDTPDAACRCCTADRAQQTTSGVPALAAAKATAHTPLPGILWPRPDTGAQNRIRGQRGTPSFFITGSPVGHHYCTAGHQNPRPQNHRCAKASWAQHALLLGACTITHCPTPPVPLLLLCCCCQWAEKGAATGRACSCPKPRLQAQCSQGAELAGKDSQGQLYGAHAVMQVAQQSANTHKHTLPSCMGRSSLMSCSALPGRKETQPAHNNTHSQHGCRTTGRCLCALRM